MSHLNMLIAYEKRIFQQGDPLRECFIFCLFDDRVNCTKHQTAE